VTLTLQPVRIGNDYDEDGCLVFADDRLVVVLVRLSEQHGDVAGQWFYENGYGQFDGPEHPIFSDLDAAQTYIADRSEPGHRVKGKSL
jgi:hypothetical protein